MGSTLLILAACALGTNSGTLDVRTLGDAASGFRVAVYDGEETIFTSVDGVNALSVVQPQGRSPIKYGACMESADGFSLVGGSAPGVSISETWRRITPALWERVVSIEAGADCRYYLELGWKTAPEGDIFSFQSREDANKSYALGFTGPGFADTAMQTFPMLGIRHGNVFHGMIGDTPGLWENRSFLSVNVDGRVIALATGDGSTRREVMIPREVDATSVYRAYVDGWQRIESGERQTFTTWLYASPVNNQYDVQLSAHIALANAKGLNGSALEAILRNTSYLLLRRNLLRPESDFIFISGVGYGWKQWVSDGFWMSRGLDDARFDAASNAAVFYERIDYEDNAQYFLIWSHIVKKAGGDPDPRTVARAYHFIRNHEVDGLYIPPRLVPEKACMKTYHDQLPYDDDDAPSSNQGFHCGALMAARELGFDVTDADIEKAVAGYCRMFNESGGYFATSLKQQEHVGQDSLYGEVLTYAVFGKKLLPDNLVRRHLETTMKIQSPYGMRVISKANGDLLEGHSGVYVWGGSWFLNDGANYLAGLIHGMDPAWVDERLLWRLEKELAWMPAFHESISTVTGKPHGHHLYSWNSGFWWLRREVRRQLGMNGPDPLLERLDARLGVVHRDGYLALEPANDNLQRSLNPS